MIDFHTHLLPQIDDGSHSVQESTEMLRELYRQGVDTAVATPHFYGDRMTLNAFVQNRDRAYEKLLPLLDKQMPAVIVGAEVAFFEGIGHSEAIRELCIGASDTLLLEMPFTPWTPRMLSEVEDIRYRRDIRVVLAHIERYLPMQSEAICRQLFTGGLTLQMNAETLLSFRTRRMGLHLLESGRVQVLGSDCHGMQYRPPRMAEAAERIRKKLGEEMLLRLDENARELLTPVKEKTLV